MEEEKIKTLLKLRAGLWMYYAGIVLIPISVLLFVVSFMFFIADPLNIEFSTITPTMFFYLIFYNVAMGFWVFGLPMYLTGRKRKNKFRFKT